MLTRIPQMCFVVLMVPTVAAFAQERLSADIRINQIGYYPLAAKTAVVIGETNTEFYIANPDRTLKLFSGKLSAPIQSSFSARKTQIADFSTFSKTGTFVLVVPAVGYSFPFEIKEHVMDGAARASLKAFYFQRFSTALPESFAGKWSRPLSHPDERVLIHASAADSKRGEGAVISTPRGWMDAGDYNKYVVNSGISTATLLSAYEDFPAYYAGQDIGIPESSNNIPDILDEVLWNLRWMLTMQDPGDGGVYHKCTNAKFDPMVMPHMAATPRYVVQKSTAAALNLAAVTAQASRVFRAYGKELPGLADSCLKASTRAWDWALQNRAVYYDQNKINAQFEPDITTGAYGDSDLSDEFVWAACELATTTKDAKYLSHFSIVTADPLKVPSWNQVRLLGYYTLMRKEKELQLLAIPFLKTIREGIVGTANKMIAEADRHDFRIVMGANPKDFVWGSNAVAANQGILLLNAFSISGDRNFLRYALDNLDYLLGRNATGYSYLTGHGDRTPMHPHHRPSEADGIAEPVPGLLVGGPNPGMQDKCMYPSNIPDEAYVDDVCSYASNEIAINWNAPFVYLIGAIEALSSR
jgi:endoglucanase